MIKASEGGGGKGIRKCEHLDDFPSQFRQVLRIVNGFYVFWSNFTVSSSIGTSGSARVPDFHYEVGERRKAFRSASFGRQIR